MIRGFFAGLGVISSIAVLYITFDECRSKVFIETFVLSRLPAIMKDQSYLDPKSRLQEIIQERMAITPIYRVMAESGPDHAKVFEVGVYIDDRLIGQGSGPAKQDAEVVAAKNALEKQDF